MGLNVTSSPKLRRGVHRPVDAVLLFTPPQTFR